MLITNLYHCVEKQLGTQHLIENLYNYMYEKRQEKTTPAYWEVLCRCPPTPRPIFYPFQSGRSVLSAS